MRVITGSARGRRLITLEGEDIRPTTDKVKEAVFSSIQFEIEGRSVLDLFAGSGSLGIEALSRGAKKAVFCDLSRQAVGVINKNLENTRLDSFSTVINTDGISYLRTTREKFDIIFMDPPYRKQLIDKAMQYAHDVMNSGGVIVCESAYDEILPEKCGDFTVVKEAKYGKTKVTYYRAEANA